MAYTHVPDAQRQTLHKKSQRLCFIGYSKESKEYRLFDEKTSKVIIQDVTFHEADFGHIVEPGAVKLNDRVEVDSNLERVNGSEMEDKHRHSTAEARIRT